MNDMRDAIRARAAETEPSIAPSGDTPSVLSSLLGALSADGSGSRDPDLARMAAATGMDPDAFREHAETLWRHMDSLADDPEAYRAFLGEKARDAGVDGFLPGGGGGGGADAFPFSFGNTGAGARDANGDGAGSERTAPASRAARADSRKTKTVGAAGDERATFLAPAPTRRREDGDHHHLGVGVVAVWRARELLESLEPSSSASTLVPVRAKRGAPPRGEKVALPDPRVSFAPEDAAPATPLAALKAAGAPPPMDATVYDVEAHPDAVARALEDPQYQASLIEAATRLAEAQDGVEFVRDPPGGRRCYARRGEAPARVAAAAAAADARRVGLGEGMEGMSASLLTEIAGMGLGDKHKSSFPSPAGRSAGEGKTTTNAPRLVEEIASSRSVRVERDAAGAPVLVSVTMRLPQLASMKDANLEVGARFITLDPGLGEPRAAVALPVAVDPDAARAKWTKKTRTLVVAAPPREETR